MFINFLIKINFIFAQPYSYVFDKNQNLNNAGLADLNFKPSLPANRQISMNFNSSSSFSNFLFNRNVNGNEIMIKQENKNGKQSTIITKKSSDGFVKLLKVGNNGNYIKEISSSASSGQEISFENSRAIDKIIEEIKAAQESNLKIKPINFFENKYSFPDFMEEFQEEANERAKNESILDNVVSKLVPFLI